MAKKKPEPAAAPPPASRPKGRPKLDKPKPPTPIVMTIRGKPEWQEWLDELCDRIRKVKEVGRLDRTEAVDAGLRLLAERYGMDAPPDRY